MDTFSPQTLSRECNHYEYLCIELVFFFSVFQCIAAKYSHLAVIILIMKNKYSCFTQYCSFKSVFHYMHVCASVHACAHTQFSYRIYC
jgi:hypothetical protein